MTRQVLLIFRCGSGRVMVHPEPKCLGSKTGPVHELASCKSGQNFQKNDSNMVQSHVFSCRAFGWIFIYFSMCFSCQLRACCAFSEKLWLGPSPRLHASASFFRARVGHPFSNPYRTCFFMMDCIVPRVEPSQYHH